MMDYEFSNEVYNWKEISEKAFALAKKAHKGQVDKNGVDYIQHPMKVASYVETDEEKTVAYLHDVVEDTSVTLRDLEEMGFPVDIVRAVDCITKREGEPLQEYFKRIISSDFAFVVKLADMKHNSDITRYKHPTEADYARCEKYKKKAEELKRMREEIKRI